MIYTLRDAGWPVPYSSQWPISYKKIKPWHEDAQNTPPKTGEWMIYNIYGSVVKPGPGSTINTWA